MFHLHILFIHFALFRQNLENLSVCHVSLALQVFNPRVSNRDVNVNLGIFGKESPSLSLLALKQSFIFEPALLLVFLPRQVNNLLIELGEVIFILDLLFLHLLVDLVTLACEVLLLFNSAV